MTTTKSLAQLIKAKKLDYVNSDITEAKFPAPKNISTPSELIEACGEHFHSLKLLSNGNWRCYGGIIPRVNDSDWGYARSGSTPEEAVANLWLALNKK